MEGSKTFDLSGRKLFIALPAYDFKVSLKLAVSLAMFCRDSAKHGIEIQIGSICGCSVVSRARNLLAQDFIDSDCTDLLFIDSDINFEPEAIYRLMSWATDEKKGIVAGVPRVRDVTPVYVADLDVDEDNNLSMNGYGLVRARRVATAFMLVTRAAFEALFKKYEHLQYYDKRTDRTLTCLFDFELCEEGYKGEDYLFCDRVIEAGFEVWVDPAIPLGIWVFKNIWVISAPT
jgi:hypothetical protein